MTVWKKLAVPTAGVVFVVLGGVKSADAAIMVYSAKEVNDTFAQANPLPAFNVGDTVSILGHADTTGSRADFFSFTAKPDELISASASSPGLGQNPTISLYSADRTLLASSNAAGPTGYYTYEYKATKPSTFYASYVSPTGSGDYSYLITKYASTSVPDPTSVPEPSYGLSSLVVGVLGATSLLTRKVKSRQVT